MGILKRKCAVRTLDAGITLLADEGDFFNLNATAGTAGEIIEVRVWQSGSATLAMGALVLRRGTTAGSGGAALTEEEYEPGAVGPIFVATQLPTTDMTALDLEVGLGWNNLQEAVWLPTPEIQIPLRDNHNFSIGQIHGGIAHTKVGVQVTWVEFTI